MRGAAVLVSIAANVRRLRQRGGLTQAQLAELADLELRFVQRVEGGRINFGVVGLAAIADALDVTTGQLFRSAVAVPRPRGRPPKKAVRVRRAASRAT